MALLLSVPFRKQQAIGYCLPACVQMVLAYQQIDRSQNKLAQQLQLRPAFGAPTRSVLRLVLDKLQVTYGEGALPSIQKWLDASVPVIAFIQAGELSYWQGEFFQHAVVIVGMDTDYIWLLDPDQDDQPLQVSVAEFMLAWVDIDYLYAAIYGVT